MVKGSEANRLTDLLPELARAIGCAQLSIGEQLSSASTGSRWLLIAHDGRFVATFDTPLAKAMGIDRDFQLRMLAQLRDPAIGPDPVFRDTAAGVTVVGYIAGASPAATFATDHEQLAMLAQLLRSLHATDLEFAGDFLHTRFESRLDRYAKLVRSAESETLFRAITERASAYRDMPAALCHNDAHIDNILVGEKLRLIDWDYAGAGPIWFDLVSVIAGLGLRDGFTRYFLDAYFGPETEWSPSQLADWLEIRTQVERLWKLCVASQIDKT